MTNMDNRFVISLDFGDVLHHCNANKFLIYLHVTKCVRLRGDRSYEICFDRPQHGTITRTLLLLIKIHDYYYFFYSN